MILSKRGEMKKNRKKKRKEFIYLKTKVICTNPKNLKKLLGLNPREME